MISRKRETICGRQKFAVPVFTLIKQSVRPGLSNNFSLKPPRTIYTKWRLKNKIPALKNRPYPKSQQNPDILIFFFARHYRAKQICPAHVAYRPNNGAGVAARVAALFVKIAYFGIGQQSHNKTGGQPGRKRRGPIILPPRRLFAKIECYNMNKICDT